MLNIQITLTAANMGPDATEADFDRWAQWVAKNVEGQCDLPKGGVFVDQFPFDGGDADDQVIVDSHGGLTTHDEASIEERVGEWLAVDGWNAYCCGSAA